MKEIKLTKNQKEILALMQKIGSKWVVDGRTKRTYDKLAQMGYLRYEGVWRDPGTWYHLKK